MSIISPLPYTIVNGSVIDADPVMADFNQIVNNVNSNAAALNGNSGQVFNVATATTVTEAVALGQLTAPAPNLLANGSAEFGSLDWSFPPQAGYTTGYGGEGTFFTLSSAVTGTYIAFSADYAVGGDLLLTLQAEIFAGGLTAGQLRVDLEFLDSTHTIIATVQALLVVSADQDWTFMSNSATTPVGTAYWHARFYTQSATLANGGIRKIKVSSGTAASPYSREADFPAIQANLAAINGSAVQVFNVATAVTNNEAVPYGQAQSEFAAVLGSPVLQFAVANATATQSAVPLGQAQADFAALAGLSTQVFNVAPASLGTQAVSLIQLPGIVNNSALSVIADCNASTLGYAEYNSSTANTPVAGTYGILLTVSSAGSPTPSSTNWVFQFATDTANNPTSRRQNINNGGWTAWVSP
jgi:hypothetical protein